jgi:hypothetical protein
LFFYWREADGKEDLDPADRVHGKEHSEVHEGTRSLWSLLLSAQQNASGVPQRLLDEKEADIYFLQILSCFVLEQPEFGQERGRTS